MACALTSGYSLDCNDAIGGIKSLRFIEHTYISNGTITASSGTITTLTPSSSKKFWKYELPPINKDFWKETWQSSRENGTLFWSEEIQLTLRKLSATLRNELRLLAQNRLACIVEDWNGKYWLVGQTGGLELDPSEANTGTGKAEFNGYVFKLMGEESAPAQEVSSSIIAALTN